MARVAVAVVALHGAALVVLALLVATTHASASILSAALLAYLLGLRHSLDADHLSCIDNSTRKFLADGHATPSLGLAFSLGHSTVVLAAGVAVAGGASWVARTVSGESPASGFLGLIGGLISAGYLILIALLNVRVLRRAWRGFRHGEPASGHTHPHGIGTRVLARPLRVISRPWHLYVVGLLFGLGFDTASTIAVLMLAAVRAGSAAPVLLLAYPALFTAAMTLGDSINAYAMLRLYTASQPITRVRFNIVTTALSIVAALAIASMTLAGMAADAGVTWGPVVVLAGVDPGVASGILIGSFIAVALAMLALTRRPSVGI